ncbi:VanW family protein [Phytohabitans kaempferiae]|uniref:VanW family protein n=1 Tax=Phytohabitans kaempferiae TaxID=1620943 RepID=A0ABV6MGW2_9ACTN
MAPRPDATRDGRRDRRRSPRRILAGVTALAVLAPVVVVTGYAYAGDVPRGTTVLGIEIGGRDAADAAQALRTGLARQSDRLAAPVPVRLGDNARDTRVIPGEVGLGVDVDATVRAASVGGANPFTLLFGSRAVAPVVTVDAARLDEVLREDVGEDARAMRIPAITFDGTTARAVRPRPGRGLDPQRSAQALRDGWLGGHPVLVPLVDVHPVTTADEVEQLLTELAEPAVAAPVTVTTDRGTITVPPAAIAQSLLLTADQTGRITPRVDEGKLRAALAAPLARIETPARDATVSTVAGKPKLVDGRDGQRLDTAALSRDLLAVLPERDARVVRGGFTPAAPAVTGDLLASLGIKEQVSTFTTTFTGGLSSPRSQNIVRIAEEVDGAIVRPGAVFSLNEHTGERGYAQGYKDAPVIIDGKLTPGVGGGASQFTTTLFNASYYAGLEDVEHKPHSYHFSRYPSVIESTIFYPNLDLKFRNNTPYGVLIHTSYTADSITVSMWSTKLYDSVTTEWSARRDITKPRTVILEPGPSCIATDGIDGFTQDAFRIIRQDGKQLKREKFTWTYQAEPRFICGGSQS